LSPHSSSPTDIDTLSLHTLFRSHRSSSLALGPFDPAGQHVFQGSMRICLGFLFGLFTAVASKANLLLGFAFENLWVMLVLTFLRSEEHTSELQSRVDLVCRLLLE